MDGNIIITLHSTTRTTFLTNLAILGKLKKRKSPPITPTPFRNSGDNGIHVLHSPIPFFASIIALTPNHWCLFLQRDGEGDSILREKFEAVVDGGAYTHGLSLGLVVVEGEEEKGDLVKASSLAAAEEEVVMDLLVVGSKVVGQGTSVVEGLSIQGLLLRLEVAISSSTQTSRRVYQGHCSPPKSCSHTQCRFLGLNFIAVVPDKVRHFLTVGGS